MELNLAQPHPMELGGVFMEDPEKEETGRREPFPTPWYRTPIIKIY